MRLLYNLFIFLFGMAVRVAALFNVKARKWVKGRADLFVGLSAALKDVDREKNPLVWFHVSSLGEFEQGRPIIEAYRRSWPDSKILLTFFSPSGYEVRKDYKLADWVCYIPLDTPGNACRWMDIIRPEKAIFIKYDFWYNMLNALAREKVQVYFISVMFRPGQHFFRWYGGWFRRQLDAVTWFFAQNSETEALLQSIGKRNITVTGDTRFDRVYAIAAHRQSFPLVEQFAGKSRVFICGSTWKEDEDLLFRLISRRESGLKFIIAPHDPGPERIRYIMEGLDRPVVRYSELNRENAAQADILLIDSVGILAQLYQYATLAYVGGGFGAGLHNIQEPITFGVPVFIGPRYGKFREAVDLVVLGGAFCVHSSQELVDKATSILADTMEYRHVSDVCRHYVEENRGATDIVMRYFRENQHDTKEAKSTQ
jgi:3-deoxy-D-manno-octulosonic-acid transferase